MTSRKHIQGNTFISLESRCGNWGQTKSTLMDPSTAHGKPPRHGGHPLGNPASWHLLSCTHNIRPRNLPGRSGPFCMLVVLVQCGIAHLHV
jgi:hypothetical protein